MSIKSPCLGNLRYASFAVQNYKAPFNVKTFRLLTIACLKPQSRTSTLTINGFSGISCTLDVAAPAEADATSFAHEYSFLLSAELPFIAVDQDKSKMSIASTCLWPATKSTDTDPQMSTVSCDVSHAMHHARRTFRNSPSD